MEIYALILTIVGISTGYEELIGMFSSTEKAEKVKSKHMKKYGHAEHHYSIKGIELNKEINYTITEW